MGRLSAVGSRLRSPLGIATAVAVVAAVAAAAVIGAKILTPEHKRAMAAGVTHAVGLSPGTIMGPQPGQDPSKAPGVQAINDSLRAFSRSLAGTGPGLNQTLGNLVTMLADPYKADADYRQLFENSEILTSDFLKNWDSFASVIATLPSTTQLIEA